jgi:hypothetical protein
VSVLLESGPVSDVELWAFSQQSKGKAPARLQSPIIISSDDSNYDSDQLSDSPKAADTPTCKRKDHVA